MVQPSLLKSAEQLHDQYLDLIWCQPSAQYMVSQILSQRLQDQCEAKAWVFSAKQARLRFKCKTQ